MTASRPSPPDPGLDRPWHTLGADEVMARLGGSSAGLDEAQVRQRLDRHGPNELPEGPGVRPAVILARQFNSLIVWVLLAAAVVAGVLGEAIDAVAIGAIVLLNGVIGFHQEFKAERSIAALRRMTAPQARVRRGGRSVVIPAAGLVPGDLLELEAGDLVAADARVLTASGLRCAEAALTGESEPVGKAPDGLDDPDLPLGDRANLVFKGTHIATGAGTAVVVATGLQTELGRIAGLLEQAGTGDRTPLQDKLESFGRLLVMLCLGLVGLLFLLGLVRGLPFLDLFMTSVSLAVAAVPEGLPAVVTVALALGVLRMSHRRALVRRLPSVETLGATRVICTDKTGTLTVGDMTVRELYVAGQSFQVSGEGYGPHGEVLFEGAATGAEHAGPLLELATALLACNNAELVLEEGIWKVIGDPTEGAMLVAGHKAGGSRDNIERDLPKHHEVPFDSERKHRTVIRRMPDGRLRAFVNGAPDVLVRRCSRIYTEEGLRPLSDDDRQEIIRRNQELAGRSLRVLGSAYRDLPEGTRAAEVAEDLGHDLVFVGLAGMHDPPRPEAREAVRRCREAGIRVVMITGDHPHTAMAIAGELGIAEPEDGVLTGAELNRVDDEELARRVEGIAVYARVTAEHKLRIVRAWKSRDAVVAMTGDGVNDAPALKGADIGIAMGIKGTEVAKQASDLVVTDDNFASIVAAVEQGRGIYDNIRKTLQYLLAGNLAELLLMMGCIVIGLPAPLLPIHLLWINLVTDGIPALCLATDSIDPEVMRRPPRPRAERITDRGFVGRLVLAAGLTSAVCFGVYLWALRRGEVAGARSMVFTALVFCELMKSLSFRSETQWLGRLSWRGGLPLVMVVAASFGAQLLLHHVEPISRLLKTVTPDWTGRWVLLGVGLVPFLVLEAVKLRRGTRGL